MIINVQKSITIKAAMVVAAVGSLLSFYGAAQSLGAAMWLSERHNNLFLVKFERELSYEIFDEEIENTRKKKQARDAIDSTIEMGQRFRSLLLEMIARRERESWIEGIIFSMTFLGFLFHLLILQKLRMRARPPLSG